MPKMQAMLVKGKILDFVFENLKLWLFAALLWSVHAIVVVLFYPLIGYIVANYSDLKDLHQGAFPCRSDDFSFISVL